MKEALTIRDVAWAAGLFEGEGYAQFNCKAFRAKVGTTDRWTAEQMQHLFGGRVYRYHYKPERNSPVFIWQLVGPQARVFFLTVYFYLSPRRKAQVRHILLKRATMPRAEADKYKDQ